MTMGPPAGVSMRVRNELEIGLFRSIYKGVK